MFQLVLPLSQQRQCYMCCASVLGEFAWTISLLIVPSRRNLQFSRVLIYRQKQGLFLPLISTKYKAFILDRVKILFRIRFSVVPWR